MVGTTISIAKQPFVVGIADEISNTKFIEDFDKIVNYILAVQTSK